MRKTILAAICAVAAVGIVALASQHCYLIGWSEICLPATHQRY